MASALGTGTCRSGVDDMRGNPLEERETTFPYRIPYRILPGVNAEFDSLESRPLNVSREHGQYGEKQTVDLSM